MNKLNMTDVRCAALFASGLQQSDAPTGAAVAEAVQRKGRLYALRLLGRPRVSAADAAAG
jgi:hypothetical protein